MPVVVRELRVASRRAYIYRLRTWMALLASGLFALGALANQGWTFTSELFSLLVWGEYAVCLVAGLLLTVESLSREKRDGTLGLLFLTPLSGYDVVLGKFFSGAGILGFGILGTIPVLSASILIGGVKLVHVIYALTAIFSTLVFSLAAGLLISALVENSRRAASALVGVVLLSFIILPKIAGWLKTTPYHNFGSFLDSINPNYPVQMAAHSTTGFSLGMFWLSNLIITGSSCLTLAFVCWLVPRSWKDKPKDQNSSRWREFLRGSSIERKDYRSRSLNKNPIRWLGARERVPSAGFMLLVALTGLGVLGVVNSGSPSLPAFWSQAAAISTSWLVAGALLHLVLLTRIPALASQRLAEDKRSGALELIIGTKLSVREILHGEWAALRRRLASPILLVIALTAFAIWCCLESHEIQAGEVTIAQLIGEAAAHLAAMGQTPSSGRVVMGILLIVICLIFPSTWIALGMLGLWLGLKMKRSAFAAFLAFILVLAPPIIASIAVDTVLPDLGFSLPRSEEFVVVSWLALALLHNMVISLWTRWQMLQNFRTLAQVSSTA